MGHISIAKFYILLYSAYIPTEGVNNQLHHMSVGSHLKLLTNCTGDRFTTPTLDNLVYVPDSEMPIKGPIPFRAFTHVARMEKWPP